MHKTICYFIANTRISNYSTSRHNFFCVSSSLFSIYQSIASAFLNYINSMYALDIKSSKGRKAKGKQIWNFANLRAKCLLLSIILTCLINVPKSDQTYARTDLADLHIATIILSFKINILHWFFLQAFATCISYLDTRQILLIFIL